MFLFLSLSCPGSSGQDHKGRQPVQAFPVRAITSGPKHHFFGYYDITPWDKTGRYVLANEIDFIGRQPRPGELLTLGMVNLKNGRFIAFDETPAWCWQMGARLQWLGSAPEREVIYNTVHQGQYAAVIRDVFTGRTRALPRPIYALSGDGKQAVTLDFDRLHRLRPGYGYQALPEKHKDDPVPKDAGIYSMNLQTGNSRLIIPIAWAAANMPDSRFRAGAHHWFNHLLFNPSGSHFIFLHRWQKPGQGWWTRMYTAKNDGSERRLVFDDGLISHFDWQDDNTILAWARSKENGDRFYLHDLRTGERRVIGEGILTRDGHCSFSPNRRWILNDTYPDAKHLQSLMIYRPIDSKRIDLGQFYLPAELKGPWRCDLHPRWNRDGTQACIDSGHETGRQMYVIDIGKLAH